MKTSVATILGNITVFEPNLWPGLSRKEKIYERIFESHSLCQLVLSTLLHEPYTTIENPEFF